MTVPTALARLAASHRAFWLLLSVPALVMAGQWARAPDALFDLLHPSGEWSVRLMIAAMAVSPLQAILGRRPWLLWLQRRRRAIGVAAFSYGLLHLILYLADLGAFAGDWSVVTGEALLPAIWTGYAALVIFALMAATSNRASERLLRRQWKRLQRLVYPAAVLVALHWGWIDNGWAGVLVWLGPLALLEAMRIVIIIRGKRSRVSGGALL